MLKLSVNAIREQSVNAIREQSVNAIREQSVNAIREQSVNAIHARSANAIRGQSPKCYPRKKGLNVIRAEDPRKDFSIRWIFPSEESLFASPR